MNQFKIGDKVRIKKDAYKEEGLKDGVFVNEYMIENLGEEGVVQGIDDNELQVLVNGDWWKYRDIWLELVAAEKEEKKPVARYQVGDLLYVIPGSVDGALWSVDGMEKVEGSSYVVLDVLVGALRRRRKHDSW